MRLRFPWGRLMRITGQSMAPVLKSGELIFVYEGGTEFRTPRRGEIVAARPAAMPGKTLVKRVVGLPHERFRVGADEWALGAGEFFLLGDRWDDSLDSRRFGPVTREEILGPVRRCLRPWLPLTVPDTRRVSGSVGR